MGSAPKFAVVTQSVNDKIGLIDSPASLNIPDFATIDPDPQRDDAANRGEAPYFHTNSDSQSQQTRDSQLISG